MAAPPPVTVDPSFFFGRFFAEIFRTNKFVDIGEVGANVAIEETLGEVVNHVGGDED